MHNICYVDLDGKKTIRDVRWYVGDAVSHSGDGYGTESVTDLGVFDNYESARQAIEKKDSNGSWYGGYAAKYYDYSTAKKTKAMSDLEAKIADVIEKRKTFTNEHMPNAVKAELITCKHCGSKIAKKFLHTTSCPVCRTDMRPEYVMEKIKGYEQKERELRKKIEDEKEKQKKCRKEMWLVKYEYHS